MPPNPGTSEKDVYQLNPYTVRRKQPSRYCKILNVNRNLHI